MCEGELLVKEIGEKSYRRECHVGIKGEGDWEAETIIKLVGREVTTEVEIR